MQSSRTAGGPSSTASRRAAASAAAAAVAAQDRSSSIRDMDCRPAQVDGPPATAPPQDTVLLRIDAIARRRTSIGPPSATREVVHIDELDDRFADDEDSHLDGSPGRRRVFAEMMKRKAKAHHGVRACQKCHRSKTPRWRRGPSGPKTLCNVCGLVYAKRESWRLRDSWLANISRRP